MASRHRLLTPAAILLLSACAAIGPQAIANTVKATDLANRRVMILGDSITQNGQYVSFLSYYLMKQHPTLNFDLISIGLGSETASGLSEDKHPFPRPCVHERLQRALDKIKPEVVFACYGMNDGIYHPASPERDKAYHDGINKLINDCQANGVKRVIILTPGIFDPLPITKKLSDSEPWAYFRPYSKYDDVLSGYAEWIMALKRNNVSSINLHGPMTDLLKSERTKNPHFSFSKDGIHPSAVGHLSMAHAILAGLGEPIPKSPLSKELQSVQSDPLFSLVNKWRMIRSKGWLSFVGYTRGKTIKSDKIAPTEKQAMALLKTIDATRNK